MISFSLFPLFKKHLSHLPQIQEKMVRGLLVPLAIADVSDGLVILFVAGESICKDARDDLKLLSRLDHSVSTEY